MNFSYGSCFQLLLVTVTRTLFQSGPTLRVALLWHYARGPAPLRGPALNTTVTTNERCDFIYKKRTSNYLADGLRPDMLERSSYPLAVFKGWAMGWQGGL